MYTHRIGKLDIDQPRLVEELKHISGFKFSDAYSDYLCGGPWKSCMLWSIGGQAGDGFVTNYDYDKPAAKTEYADKLPYLTEIIEKSFSMEYLNFARIAVISNSVIIPHKDLLELDKVPPRMRNTHRLHVPLITNEHCYFSEGNVVYRMKFGEAWFFDSAKMHSAASFTEEQRVHLMLDFADVDDSNKLVKFNKEEGAPIPAENIRPRGDISDSERDALLSLSSVIDIKNYRDVFSIVIKKHYSRNGGDNFIWDTMMKIAKSSQNQEVDSKINEMYEYFLVQRSA